jgi:putative ABC transport system ATP-binding protein
VAKLYEQTILLITHDYDIAQLADRIVQIEDGKIVKGDDIHAGQQQ